MKTKKQLLFISALIFNIIVLKAQVPNQFKYQAVLRDTKGNIIINMQKSILIEILMGFPIDWTKP